MSAELEKVVLLDENNNDVPPVQVAPGEVSERKDFNTMAEVRAENVRRLREARASNCSKVEESVVRELLSLQVDAEQFTSMSLSRGRVPFEGAKRLRDPIYSAIDARVRELAEQNVSLEQFVQFIPPCPLRAMYKFGVPCKGCAVQLPCHKKKPSGYSSRPIVTYSPAYFEHVYACDKYRTSGQMNYCLVCKLAFAHYADFHSHQFAKHETYLILVAKSATLNAHVIV